MTSDTGAEMRLSNTFGTLADAADALVGEWAAHANAARADGKPDASPTAGLLTEAEGFDFGRDFMERVALPDDAFVAAEGLRQISREVPDTLPAPLRLALRAGGLVSLGLPWAVVPLAKRRLRQLIAPLVLTANPREASGRREIARDPIARALDEIRASGCEPAATLLGDPVLGPDGAAARIEGLTRLLDTPGLEAISIDLAGLLPSLGNPNVKGWALDDEADRAVDMLGPLARRAAELGVSVTLEAYSYRAALLIPEVFERLLESLEPSGAADPAGADPAGADPGGPDPGAADLDLGITVLAQLPESLPILARVAAFAQERAGRGFAPVHVRITRGQIAAEETAAAILSGLSVPTLESREAVDAQLIKLLDFALQPERTAVLRPVLATRHPHTVALGVAIACQLGTQDRLVIEVTRGNGVALTAALTATGIRPRVLAPVVPPTEFRGALTMLRDLLELRAANGSVFELADSALFDPVARAAGRARVTAALAAIADLDAASHRLQSRAREWDPSERDSALFYRPPADPDRLDTGGLTAAVLGLVRGSTGVISLEAAGDPVRVPAVSRSGFANEPDTDASRRENRDWMREILARAAASTDGVLQVEAARAAALDPEALIGAVLESGAPWRLSTPHERATRLRRAALGTVAARDRLLEVLAAETGRPVAEIDAEVSDAVDAARYLGQLADGLGAVRGAQFRPDGLAVVVTSPAAPLARAAEAVAAVLAAGSAVVLLAHPVVARTAAVLLEEWEATGLPVGLVRLAVGDSVEGHAALAASLVADHRTDRALVFGAPAEARALVRRRPDLRIDARLDARGTILVTPSADFAAAARDIAASAFLNAGRDLSSARLVVLLGSVARSTRFTELLADAVRAIRAGDTAHPRDLDPLSYDMGPMATEPTDVEWSALTELAGGERWLVKPVPLDETGRLWSPGVRTGVQKDSAFVRDGAAVPVIGVLTAHTLSEAIALQNAQGTGAVAGLHSTDPDEIGAWVDQVQAATLVVGRPTTGLRVERQPSGGWNEAGMGAQPLNGGPSRLVTLGSWEAHEGAQSSTLHLRGLDPEVQLLIEAAHTSLDYEAFDRLRRAALSDALTWRTSLGVISDRVGLGVEGNLLRYWPAVSHIRAAEGVELSSLLRVLVAALVAQSPCVVSVGDPLPREISEVLAGLMIEVSLERDEAWLERIAAAGPPGPGVPAQRIRLIGGDRVRAAEWMGGLDRAELWAEPVTMAGPVELMSFLREQSLSITAHQRGIGTGIVEALFPAGRAR